MNKFIISFLALFFLASSAEAYVEIGLNYSYRQQINDGVETSTNPEPGEVTSSTKIYGLSWAWYIWEYTALELNYSQSLNTVIDTRELSSTDSGTGTTTTFTQLTSEVKSQAQGVGLRQSFANRKARIIPSLSIGYAKLTSSGETTYQYKVNDVEQEDATLPQPQESENSAYVSVSLRIKLTQLMGLTFMGKSILPDFDTAELDKNIAYNAGFSWVF